MLPLKPQPRRGLKSIYMRFVAVLALSVSCLCAQKRPLDVQAMLQFSRISEPQVSPDGKQVAFTVQTIDLDKNAKPRQIWTVPLDGGVPRQITRDGNNERPRWTPDSRSILFVSSRGGASQVWRMDPDGNNAKQLTSLATEASGVLLSPDGKWILFTSDVYPDCPDDACNKKRLDAEAANKVKARIYTSLLYRHWTEWQGAKRRHLFAMSLEEGGTPKDLTPGIRDVPPFSLGGPDDYAVSPDSKEVCFVMNGDTDQALSTNSDLWVVPIEGGESKKVTINPGADNAPAYSADSKSIAFRSQQRGGYESDRWRLQVLDRASGRTVTLTDNLDRNVTSFTWSVDSKRIFFLTEDRGRTVLQMIPASGGSSRVLISGGGHIDDVQFPADGKTMIYSEMGATRPTELYKVASSGGAAVALTKLNEPLMQSLAIAAVEDFWVKAPDETQINSFLVKPPDFKAESEVPRVVFDPRRPARRVGRCVELSVEPAGLCQRRLRGCHAESARLHRLWPEVHRRDQPGLGWQGLRRRDGRGGSRRRAAVCG
jgi:dipeptidyl aminopeptidase/acylaminoacyl peptidase